MEEKDEIDIDDGDEDGFDYDEFVEREFGSPLRSKSTPLHWQLVAIGLLFLSAIATLFTLLSS